MGRLSLAALLLAACSGSGEYTCPDPVGRIIRDDCEAYRTRYESLKVELGASLGPMGASVAAGQQALRDPSELLQVLAHRTHALCRDFNACRVMPLEYRQRREQTDCIFTAVSAIQSQLSSDLDAESKAKLVKELTRVLSGETCGGPVSAGSPPPAAAARPPSPRKRTFYSSSTPWFGTRLLPPQPKGPDGVPRLVDADFSLKHVFRGKSPHGIIGYRPKVALALLGKASADDMVTVDWGGQTSDCNIRSGSNELAAAYCEAPESLTLTGTGFSARVIYRRGVDGKTFPLGERRATVLVRRVEGTKNDSHRYGISHEDEVGQGMLIFRPGERYLPPPYERPHLFVVLRVRKYRDWDETARCWVDGTLVTQALKGRQGHVGQFQDRARYQDVGPHSIRAVAHPFIYWRSVHVPLPFVVKRDGTPKTDKKDRPWPLPGAWRCVVTVDGEPVRELRFSVKRDGRLEPHPRQTERPRAAWLVQTRVLDSPIEDKQK
ncbi:MAG: hypothetical protein JRI55_35570 [Deltaproteobacteria bacterium]|nr:hypothetical protein [Deltaproteobacteria bacterium]